jgi:hypothetical protein
MPLHGWTVEILIRRKLHALLLAKKVNHISESTKYNLPHWNQEIALGYFCSVITLVPQFRVLTTEAIYRLQQLICVPHRDV